MKKKLNCILLVDDNYEDNYFHQIIIRDMNITENIQIAKDGEEALQLLKDPATVPPELIFLDINMPRMNGWEFLAAYEALEKKQKADVVIMMLTTSQNPADHQKANAIGDIAGFKVKPLSQEMLDEIMETHFKDYL